LELLSAGPPDRLSASPAGPPARLPAPETPVFDLDQIERHAIDRALVATGGNRTRAAKLLGISERTLRNKLNTPKAAATPKS
jgi:DNA-binding NtrC family response regulator